MLTAFLLAVTVVILLLLLMAIGIWIYTSQIVAREQSLLTQVVPQLDTAYELTAVSAEMQTYSSLFEGVARVSELESYRQEMGSTLARAQALLADMQELDINPGEDLIQGVTEIGLSIDGLADSRARQIRLSDEVDDERNRLLSITTELQKLIQRHIIVLTDEQLGASDIVYSMGSASKSDDAAVDSLLDSLLTFERKSLAIQDNLGLNQDLIALNSVIEQVPLLTTTTAITQAMQRRDLLLKSMVNHVIYLAETANKQDVLERITNLRSALRTDNNLFAMQQKRLTLIADQQELNSRLIRNTESILSKIDDTRATTRSALSAVTTQTLRALADYRYFLLLAAAAALTALTWISYKLLYRGTVVPLVDITKQLEYIGTDNFAAESKNYFIKELSTLSHAVRELDEAQRILREKDKLLSDSNEELRRVNSDLEQFAHVASHDLQEPLRKLQQFSDLLVEDYESVLDSDGKFFLGAIKNSAARMSLMIKDILTYSRTGTQDQALETINLAAVLDSLRFDLEMAIADAQATIMIEDLPTVLGNRTGIEQLFRNLLINALKYRKPDTPSEIMVSAGCSEHLSGCVVTVQDNGVGISAENHARIFTPFERLNTGTVRGTGLGLAICARVCEAHGWKLDVRSEVGEGSRFRIQIPQHSISDASA